MKAVFLISLMFLAACSACAQVDTAQKIVEGRVNSTDQQKKPYVILISADGFRYDYAAKYNAAHLLKLADEGVKAESMIPAYPSVTFPNHYTLVTGLYPSHHGLVNNSFYDRKKNDYYQYTNKAKVGDKSWYGGTPLWVLAEQRQMLSASFYWVGSEAPVKDIRPTYYYVYNDKINIHDRIGAVMNWLNLPPASRPHFITFYLPQVDHAGHVYGPDAPETAREVQFVDSAIYELTKAVKTTGLSVNYIFVSDHGMSKIDTLHPLGIPAAVDTSKFRIFGDGTLVELYAKNPGDVKGTYERLKKDAKDYKVYLRLNMPAHTHYSSADDRYNRIGDILLVPEWPGVFNLYSRKLNAGTHGYDPVLVKEMLATFYAWGPAFKPHTVIASFPNVDVYPVVAKILGLPYTEKIDGSIKTADEILLK